MLFPDRALPHSISQTTSGRVLCQRDEKDFDRAVLHLLSAYDRGEPVRPLSPMDSHCKFFREIMASAYQSYNQAFVHEASRRRTAEQYAYMNRQLSGVSALLSLLGMRLREDRWGDERVENALIPYLVRRGFAPLSVDAFYLGRRLCLSLRLSARGRVGGAALADAVGRKLGRTMRLIASRQEGDEIVFEMEALKGLTTRMARISLPEDEESVCGDETGELKMPSGKVVYAVSDGMGSGEEANRESRAAIDLLFDQFRLGVERELIYENVNRLLMAQGGREVYATLDAASIDLTTGEAEMVKFGAPPTCLIRGETVRTLSGEALPCPAASWTRQGPASTGSGSGSGIGWCSAPTGSTTFWARSWKRSSRGTRPALRRASRRTLWRLPDRRDSGTT